MMSDSSYERTKEQARRASALRSLAGREISPLPPVGDWTRRRRGVASLLEFCRLYFPEKFKKPFGKNHLALVDAFQRVISDGGKQAVAMPRGTGKTTIATVAAVWALFSARRRFVVIVAANTKEARKLLKSIQSIVGTNPRLAQDFPEICVPVRALKGSALLARGQLFYGVPTNVQMAADSFRLPTVAGSPPPARPSPRTASNPRFEGFPPKVPTDPPSAPTSSFSTTCKPTRSPSIRVASPTWKKSSRRRSKVSSRTAPSWRWFRPAP